MNKKIKNLTKHKITLIDRSDVVPKDRHSGKFLLRKELKDVKPILEVEPLVPLNVNEIKGIGAEYEIEGLPFKVSSFYTQHIDGFKGICIEDNELLIVSKKYAEAAKNILNPYLLDRLFIPAGIVEDNKKIVGCTQIQKLMPFFLPSQYLTMPSDFATKMMAIEFWKMRWNQLSPVEFEALQKLLNCAEEL